MITIFTPTYNRAHTLPRLYESLKNQTSKDFEWLIVDDGSIDETKDLIESYIAEQKINIRYFFQENKGKHFAINKGLNLAEGHYFVNIDSDDFLLNYSVWEMENLITESEALNAAGFTFLHFAQNSDFNAEQYGKRKWRKGDGVIIANKGEMMFCLKTNIYCNYPFPEFEGEKFCPESLVLRRIEKKHLILYTDKVLVRGDYLEDGLSSKFYQLMFNNPHASLLNYKERIAEAKTFKQKLFVAKNYYGIAWKSDKTTVKEKFFNLNPLLTMAVLWDKLKK